MKGHLTRTMSKNFNITIGDWELEFDYLKSKGNMALFKLKTNRDTEYEYFSEYTTFTYNDNIVKFSFRYLLDENPNRPILPVVKIIADKALVINCSKK